jgi:hypothetical protein
MSGQKIYSPIHTPFIVTNTCDNNLSWPEEVNNFQVKFVRTKHSKLKEYLHMSYKGKTSTDLKESCSFWISSPNPSATNEVMY